MQTANYTVNSGGGVALWRGIPAQITISGLESTSGDWLFLVDNNNADGVILSGTVAASGECLTVTLENMNTIELQKAINGKPLLDECRATLTDGVSRVYIIPLVIRNRAMDGQPPPTPVSEYYTKAQVDAMIAAIPMGTTDYIELKNKPAINGHTLNGDQTAADLGLATPGDIPPAQVQSDWNETDTASKSYIQNKPSIPSVPVQSVNSKTGDVVLNASDVGAVSTDGLPIVALESGTIPAPGAVYTFTPDAAAEFVFPTPVAGKDNAFRLVLTMPDPAVAVTFPAGLTWKFATPALAAGTTSELAFAWNVASWEGWAVPDMSEYMPKTGGTFSGNVDMNGILRLELGKSLVLRSQNAQATGYSSIVIGTSDNYANYALCIGFANKLYGQAGIAAGTNCNVAQNYAYAFGIGNRSALSAQTVVGQYNLEDANAYFIVGNGTSASAKSNAFTVKTNGNAVLAGDLTFKPTGASAATTLSALIARIEALEQAIQ